LPTQAEYEALRQARQRQQTDAFLQLYHRVAQSKARARGSLMASLGTALFKVGYFVTWAGFGLVAYGVGRGLDALAMRWPALAMEHGVLIGAALTVAGAYQVMPLKSACLTHCRSHSAS